MKSDNSNVVIKPLNPDLGAEVSDISIADSLSMQSTLIIEDAMRRYKALLFRGQSIDAPTLAQFGTHFGQLQAHVQKRYQREEIPEVVWIRNRKADGSFDEIGAARGSAVHTRDGWHSDMVFDLSLAKLAILHALDIPSQCGNS